MSEQIERVEKTDRIKPPALRWEGISPVDIILKQPTTEPSLNKNNRVLEVKLYWGDVIMETVHKNITSAITIGEDPKSTFRVSSDRLSNPHSFELVRPDSTGNICFGTGDVPITIKRQGKVYDFEQAKELKLLDSKEGKYSFRIELEDIVIVKIDELYFVIRYVTPAKAIPFSIWDTLDYYFWTIWTLSFIAHMFFLIAVQITDPNVDYLTEDLF